jgi:N-acetylglucosamine-6-phosphate deacetylase
MKRALAITGGTCITPFREIPDSLVLCEDGRITWVGERNEGEPPPRAEHLDATGLLVLPGLIDTHVHGSHGDDVMLDGVEGIRRISAAQLRYGTTAYLPSTVSARPDELRRAVEWCREAARSPGRGAEIVGIHVEGPFINRRKKGAQPEEGIRDPDSDECRRLIEEADGLLRMMTLAPELPGGLEMIRFLRGEGIIASLGHSDADYGTTLAAIDAGATHATHLFNAMPPLHHRAPGLAAACLNEPEIQTELIADGVHVSPEMVRLAIRAKGPEHVVLITDAMAAVGRPDGIYTLGKNRVIVRGDVCLLEDGVTIASSMLTMNFAVRNAQRFAAVPLTDAVRMATLVPAQVCGCADRKGSIEIGKDADLALLRPDFTVAATVLRGEVVYRGGEHGMIS